MSTITKTIKQLLAHVDGGQLVLPEFQREFVWATRSVMLLFDSLYRGMPIGHMLVWKARRFVHATAIGGRGKLPDVFHDNFYGYLLDGQQRLTALKRVLEHDEYYPLMFYLYPEKKEEEDFYWQRSWNKDDPWTSPSPTSCRKI